MEFYKPPAVVGGALDYFRAKRALSKFALRAHLQPLARADERLPGVVIPAAQQQELHHAARAGLVADQPRGDGARVVDNERVAGVQVIDHIAKGFILAHAGVAVDDHQAAGIARFDGALRDQLLRKIIVKITCLHVNPAASLSAMIKSI